MTEEVNEDRRYKPNLQGLLKFCTENTKLEDAPPAQAMSSEKQAWLKKALEGMTSNDPVKQMISTLQVLIGDKADGDGGDGVKPNTKKGETKTDGDNKMKEVSDEERCVAIEDLIMLCEDLDLANDFHTIGGFEILPSLLEDHNTYLRCSAAHLIATLAQNNPPSQAHVIQHPFLLPHLLQRVNDEEEDNEMRVKSLYAISCSVRESVEGQERFKQLEGYKVIKKVISSSQQQKKLKLKSLFLLSSLCVESDAIKDLVVREALLPDVVAILKKDDEEEDVKEMAIKVVDALMVGGSSAEVCKKDAALKSVVEGCLMRWKKLSGAEDRVELAESVLKKF